jgi:hypothetical protein
MKKLIFALMLIISTQAVAVDVRGYTRNDGTYVQPHNRSAPDNNPYNNYGSSDNISTLGNREGRLNTTDRPAYGNSKAPNSGIYEPRNPYSR